MSYALPSLVRPQCIGHAGNVFCLCSRFTSFTLDQPELRCVCGHGMHAHADFMSLVVHHCPANSCVAYVQKTPKTQECSCGALLVDHVPVFNIYRPPTASSHTMNASASSNDADFTPFASLPPSSSDTVQAETDAFIAYDLGGYVLDDGALNATLDYHPNAIHDATPESGAWARSS
ncbi:uncharacterized protein EV420DRAFT_849179 [Desarmillaria tabescens]|uniref:Uncharacterized protein n=1 Tax=Armillaria tabescens TaxID=1929756 RepID=A0AA39JT18_ARMTA|nr:uncharacterized protein EV420DRAFT_849179 [Desarmillaria tabescens]KAK0448259.1 hypothetical protein EV420DRAFT_849179 [Desarmillaria tabescens]